MVDDNEQQFQIPYNYGIGFDVWQMPIMIINETEPESEWKIIQKLLKLGITKDLISKYNLVKLYAPRMTSLLEAGVGIATLPHKITFRYLTELSSGRSGKSTTVLFNYIKCKIS